jgi:hypothetical protein
MFLFVDGKGRKRAPAVAVDGSPEVEVGWNGNAKVRNEHKLTGHCQ